MNTEYIVDREKIVRPSGVAPTLFVGIGGCGSRLVTRVARHLRSRPDYDERYADLVKFALIDTNINDLEAQRELASDTFLISDFEKEQYAALASGKSFLGPDDYFTQWVPQNYRFRAGDTAGAGQIRIEARLGCYYQMKHGNFVARFQALLEQMKSHEHGHRRLDTREIRIVLCYSVAGGTGSGAHLPLAYMLRDQASRLGRPFMIGVAVLPAVFEEKTGANRDGTFANGYAALKETEHLMKLGAPDSRFYPEEGRAFHYDPSDTTRRTVRRQPFEFVYVVDKPESFSVTDPVGAAADGLYLQMFSPLFSEQAGDYDNYTQHQRFLVPHDFEAKGISGFTTFYGSYGAAVLLVPVDGLVDYCARAAALRIIRSNLLGEIPSEMHFEPVRQEAREFDQVRLTDDEEAPTVHVSEFRKHQKNDQELLLDRLFMKRIRMLAGCEFDAGRDRDRFAAAFRHGHVIGRRSRPSGELFDVDGPPKERDRANLNRNQYNESIVAALLPEIVRPAPVAGGPARGMASVPGYLALLRAKLEASVRSLSESYAIEAVDVGTGKTLSHQQLSDNYASAFGQKLRRVMRELFASGYTTRDGIEIPGLVELADVGSFLRKVADKVDQAAMRYAMLRLHEELVDYEIHREVDAARAGLQSAVRDDSSDAIQRKDVDAIRSALTSVAQRQSHEVFVEGLGEFADALSKVRSQLEVLTRGQREMELQLPAFEHEQTRTMARMMRDGDASANRYILDGEAFQIENGRRLWDFFFVDQIANMEDVQPFADSVRQLVATSIRSLGRGSSYVTASGALTRLFDDLRERLETPIRIAIEGDSSSVEPERRAGLTLERALDLELLYRAIYLSHREDIEMSGMRAISSKVSRFRHLPEEEQRAQYDPNGADERDYVRDKFKRIATEKANLLCSYDESRDEHGGVRPDHVFLVCAADSLRDGSVAEALRSADSTFKWVESGWSNPRELIIYKAVLNVPLYVFGRMRDMKAEYYRFRQLARRSKVLHIDKNWEETLPDLDPDAAQDAHRQQLLRAQIIDFAALLITGAAAEDGRVHGYIVRRNGRYVLRDPERPWPPADSTQEADSTAVLGTTIPEAVAELPNVLRSQAVRFRAYVEVLRAVRSGLSPEMLQRIVRLPFRWRRSQEDLRTQYGSAPTESQQSTLRDFGNAYARLHEALLALHDDLMQARRERETIGDEGSAVLDGLDPAAASMDLKQSIEILREYRLSWQTLDDPTSGRAVPREFYELFEPLDAERLKLVLAEIKRAGRSTGTADITGGAPGGSSGEPATTSTAAPPVAPEPPVSGTPTSSGGPPARPAPDAAGPGDDGQN